MDYIFIFALGVILGWVTKIPFLLKWYRDAQADNKRTRDLVGRYAKYIE